MKTEVQKKNLVEALKQGLITWSQFFALWQSLLIVLTLIGCGPSRKAPYETQPIVVLGNIPFESRGSIDLGGERVVDSSLIEGTLFYDFNEGANFSILKNGSEVAQYGGINFTYVVKHGGVFYKFGEGGNDIYLNASADGINWFPLNNAQPVFRHDPNPNSAWYQLWNVGVDVDSAGVWHLFVECSDKTPGQAAVGICYATGNINGFHHVSESPVIVNAGNPFVKALPQGLLIVHGMVNHPIGPFGNEWFITASTMKYGQSVETHTDKFLLGTPGIHDCDPHMDQSDLGLTLVFSVDQSHLQTAVTPLNFNQFFERLTQ